MVKLNARKQAALALGALAFVLAAGCKGTVSAEIGANDSASSGGGSTSSGNSTGNTDSTENKDSTESKNPAGNTDSANISDGIDYKSDANGTLTIRNNTQKDMVIFEGETPKKDTILGGVRAQTSRAFDVSGRDDFAVGGWMIVKGMAASEYSANKSNLLKAKIEYSAMATYQAGESYEAVINPAYTGNYCFKVNNNSEIGVELHKDSFDGEKIAYLSPNKRNYIIYCDSMDGIDLFPVYVYYSKRTKTVTTLNSSLFDTVTATPLPVDDSAVASYSIPENAKQTLSMIAGNVEIPYAYISATNNVPNQSARFKSGDVELRTQGGQNTVSGIPATFEIKSTKDGQEKSFYFSLYGGEIQVFVKDKDGKDPVIKNGYDYNVVLRRTGTDKASAASYTATIDAGTPRDFREEIKTLPTQQ